MQPRLTSLPLQLLVFIVLPLLILLVVVAFGGVVMHQAEMRDLLVNHNRQVVSGAAENLSGQIDQRQRILAGSMGHLINKTFHIKCILVDVHTTPETRWHRWITHGMVNQ